MRAGIGEEFQHFDLARGVGRLGGIELYIKGLVGPGLIDWCDNDARTNGGNGKHTQNKIFWRHGWGFLYTSEIRMQWTRHVPERHAASGEARTSGVTGKEVAVLVDPG